MQMEGEAETQQGFQTLLSSLIVNATASATPGCPQSQSLEYESESFFYSKLSELLEFSGFSLIFNVRETLLDLYLFYSEVTKRGGFHQVCREKKWGEVVSALKLEGSHMKLSGQVEMLYAHLLYQFEQLYFYRRPTKRPAASSAGDGEMVTPTCKDNSCLVKDAGFVKLGFREEQVILPTPLNSKKMKNNKETNNSTETKKSKEMKKRCPRGQSSPYSIFLRQECARLKACGSASDGSTFLSMAIGAWRKMSEIEKQPYKEESKKNKEKFKEAMKAYEKEQNAQGSGQEKSASVCAGEYHVTSQPEVRETLVVNEAAMSLDLTMSEKTPKDALFFIDLGAQVTPTI